MVTLDSLLDTRRFKVIATTIVAIMSLGVCALLGHRAISYQRGLRGAALKTAGDPGRAYPYLVRAANTPLLGRLNAAPWIDLGEVAAWAMDDPVFLKHHDEVTPLLLARLSLSAYAQALSLRPTSTTAMAGLADLFRKVSNLDLIEERGTPPTIGEILERGKQTPVQDMLVERAYRKAIEMEPANYFWYAYLADFLRERGRDPEASPLYEKAIELMPDLGWHYYLGATGPLSPTMFDVAKRGLERALDTNQVVRPERIESSFGYLYERQRDYEGALTHYRRAIEMAPDPSQYLLSAAIVYSLAGRDTEALEYFKRALARDTLNRRQELSALTHLGRISFARRDLKEAVEYLSRARAIEPASYTIRVNLARVWQALGQIASAEIEYRQAIGLDQTRRQAYELLIAMYREAGNAAAAIPLARRLVEIDPDDAGLTDLLDALYHEMGTTAPTAPTARPKPLLGQAPREVR